MELNQCLDCGDLFEAETEFYFCEACWIQRQINADMVADAIREELREDPFARPF